MLEEPPLSESPIGVQYYEKMIAERRYMGRPEFFNAAAHVLACPGRSSDHVYMFLNVDGSRITEARWQCHMCDPWMQITADIACQLVNGRNTHEILLISLQDYEHVLGGSDPVIADHTGAATLVAYKAGIDYEVKQMLARMLNTSARPKELLRELGFSGRPGMLRLKRQAETKFAGEELKIPRARLESVASSGTVQDFSLLIQDLLERGAVRVLLERGMGFPRSFHEGPDKGSIDKQPGAHDRA